MFNKRFILAIITLLFFLNNRVFAYKDKEDSLLTKFKTSKIDTQKYYLAEKLYLYYLKKSDFDRAESYNDTMLNVASGISTQKFIGMSYASRAHFFYKTSQHDSAIFWNKRAIDFAEKIKHNFVLIKSHINLGNIYNLKADYQKSITHFQKAEYYSELQKDTLGKISVTLNLGSIFFNISDYISAKKNFRKVIQLADHNAKTLPELASAYNNLATVYLNETPKQLDSSMFYYHKFLLVSQQLDVKSNIALAHFNIAEVYRNKEDSKQALENYTISKREFEVLEDTINLARVLLGIGDVYILQGNYQGALSVLKQGIEYCKSYDIQSLVSDYAKSISNAYYSLGQYKLAYDFYRRGAEISDSLYNEENSEILYEMQTKYESNEKEKQNLILSSQNELNKKEIKQQQLVTLIVVIGLILLGIFAFFIFKGLKQQRKANLIIAKQKQEVEHQKQIVEEHQKEILDSIHYAKRIQNTLLAHEDFINQNLQQNFILFKPKDIVSGDFYWATKHENKFYLAVCDSTGHGVPGAFMSLLNINFLNEAINEKGILQPHHIFNYVRERLVNSVSKDGQKDGFDGILLCFDSLTKSITYSAAHNAPVLVSDGVCCELPKDKIPVGISESKEYFKLYSVKAKPGDMLYVYTDGYADQFGGSKGKKFKYKPLNDLLLKISSEELIKQQETLNDVITSWMGTLEQVDDICVVGIKF